MKAAKPANDSKKVSPAQIAEQEKKEEEQSIADSFAAALMVDAEEGKEINTHKIKDHKKEAKEGKKNKDGKKKHHKSDKKKHHHHSKK